MIKKIVSISMALALSLGVLSFSFAEAEVPEEVADVSNGSDAKINSLINKGIVNGYNGELKLENAITRAEFSTVLSKLLVEEDEIKDYKGYSDFEDVEETTWSSPYVNILFDKGIVNGYEDNTFRPNNDVKFDELLVMVVKSLDKDIEVSEGESWSEGYINEAKELGILDGVEIEDYSNKANRQKTFEIIYNTIEVSK